MHDALLEHAWNQKRGAFTAAFGSDDLDASVLLLADLGVVEVDDPRFVSTVAAMERELVREKHVMRYASADDFGMPVTAFLICRFWLIDALWSLGRREAARDLFADALKHRNRYGLLSEDVDPQTGALVGQFPADLFDGRTDPLGDAAVAQLGRPLLARLSSASTPPLHKSYSNAKMRFQSFFMSTTIQLFYRRCIERFVEAAEGRVAIVGVFARGVGVMDDEAKAGATGHRRPLQHLQIAVGIAEGRDRAAPMNSLMPTGLPALSSTKFTSGRRKSSGLPSRIWNLVLTDEPTTCSGGTP